MRKFLLLFLVGLFFAFKLFTAPVYSDELDDINKKLSELQSALSASQKATAPLESQLKNLQTQLKGIEGRVAAVENDIREKKKFIDEGYRDLDKNKDIFNKTVRDYYIKSYLLSPLLVFISSQDAADVTRFVIYQKKDAEGDKDKLTTIALRISDLEVRKEKLEKEEEGLAAVKARLEPEREKIAQIVKGAKDYQSNLSGEIAQLSARQQQIVNSRSGGFTATIGDSNLADDINASIQGFRNSAPAGSFAVFAFGAHTHRKGMSQYGARGRAQSGQNSAQILKAYYGKEPVSKDTGGSIKVSGFGELDFEGKYLLGIAEMPSSWHPEALKAQAIAARTYAYRYKQEGKEICTTEACQVYNDGKASNPPDSWKQAVEATRGQVVEDVVTYYASTHGGFASPIGWDTTDGSGGGNFIEKAYDKIGGSPWLYKAWYTKGYSPSSDKCGRSNPWLTGEELADIINAARYRDDRVTPTTTSCWGGNPYSFDELRAKSDGPSSVSSVNVSQGNGTTNEVIFQTNKGEIRLSGSEFKTAFNLRAPGYMSIPQSGFAFFNIEKK